MIIRIVIRVLSALLLLLAGITACAQVSSPSNEVAASYGKVPLSFEPNQGQTDARVQFVSRGPGYTIFLGPTSATFALQRNATSSRPTVPSQLPSIAESAVVRMDLLGAAQDVTMQPQGKLPGITNYLMGSTRTQWLTNSANLHAKALGGFPECLSRDRPGVLRQPGRTRIRLRSRSAGRPV